jgi:GT2 family glycosyltransferase
MPCLKSVLETQYVPFEVILVDNASKDDSLREAEAAYSGDPRLKIIRNEINTGFSGGNNIGYVHSKGEFIVFLNSDTIVDSNWLMPLVIAMQNDPSIGLSQSLNLKIGGKEVGNAGWILDNYLISKRELCQGQPSSIKLKPVFDISFACGASMMTRRESIEEMGLFYPEIPFFYDDTLLSLKTWLSGKRVVTVSQSKIQHIVGATKVWKIRFTTFHLQRANLCLILDVYPQIFQLAGAMMVNCGHVLVNSIFCLKDRNIAAVLANLDAFVWGLKNFRFMWRNRIKHWSKAKVTPSVLQKNFMKVWVPPPFYLITSKQSVKYSDTEFRKIERTVLNI